MVVRGAAVEVAQRQRLRRADHRHRLPADPRAARHRGEAVPPDGADGALRARGRVRPVADARPGADELLRAAASARSARDLADAQGARGLRAGASPACCARRSITLAVGLAGARARRAALFTRLGAEFVPQLDEGDLLVEARRLPGIALDGVGRDRPAPRSARSARSPRSSTSSPSAGAPEVATDPMGIEQSDVYIILEAARRVAAGPDQGRRSRREIAEAVEQAVPEVAGGVSQPIQMRTNELIAGVRSDVAPSIYGPDLDAARGCSATAGRAPRSEASRAPSTCASSRSPASPTCASVPDRARLARYGLTVEDVNTVTETMAVGHDGRARSSRGERRFAMVVKTRASTIAATSTRSARCRSSRRSGQIVPLGDVADAGARDGPGAGQPRQAVAPAHRRVQRPRPRPRLGGRGRAAPRSRAGQAARRATAIEWGGQFEHYAEAARAAWLSSCRSRSALIVFLLWLAFGTVQPALLIFLERPVRDRRRRAGAVAARHPVLASRRASASSRSSASRCLNGLVLVSFAASSKSRGTSPRRRDRAGRRAAPAPGADDRARRVARLRPDGALHARPAARCSARSRPSSSAASSRRPR